MIRILTASPEFLPGQIRQNYQLMIQEIHRAKEEQADIIIFPELSLTGYFIGDLWESPAFLHESEAYKEKIIAAAEGITIIFGHVAIDKNKKKFRRQTKAVQCRLCRAKSETRCQYHRAFLHHKDTPTHLWAF